MGVDARSEADPADPAGGTAPDPSDLVASRDDGPARRPLDGDRLPAPPPAAGAVAVLAPVVAPPAEAVTPREAEVLQLLADGWSTVEVAGRLYISQKTVKNHLGSIYAKLGVGDRTQAVLRALRLGLVTLR